MSYIMTPEPIKLDPFAYQRCFPLPSTEFGPTTNPEEASTPSLIPSSADYEIKSWVPFFSAMITGEKKHDMRKLSDRPYRVGDKVLLREYEPFGGGYTGRSAIFRITYITSNVTPCALSSNALDNDHCILSVERISDVFVEV